MAEYTTIKIPVDMAAWIDQSIALNPMAFNNRTEFIKYCVRRFLENDGKEDFKK